MNSKIQSLRERSQGLLSKKLTLNNFWQNIAYNFYPQRAYFTRATNGSDQDLINNCFPFDGDFADNLTTSYPILVSRDLANSISTYLRPAGQPWFKAGIRNRDLDKNLGNESRKYLEFVSETMRYFFEDEATGFNKAFKQSDADITNFGQSAVSMEIDWKIGKPMFRCWMLRDMAWSEDYAGNVSFITREWNTKVRNAYEKFGDRLHPETVAKVAQQGDTNITIHHIVLKTEDYENHYKKTTFRQEEKKIKLPWVSIYCEVGKDHEIECVGSPTQIYQISRWELVSGSQYAYSPAVCAGLPDARLLQSITLSLLEAGEKAVNPPILAKADSVRSDIAFIANTVSWVKEDLPGSIDDAVKMMQIDRSGLQFGLTMQQDSRSMLRSAFYLDKITLPVFDSRMTATEVRERVAEYIRNASPLFNSMITQVNQPLCKMAFKLLQSSGAFGPNEFIPEELQGPDGSLRKDIDFTFSSPLLEAEGREKSQRFLEMKAAIAEAVALDPSTIHIPDATIALRDTLEGIGVPAKWLRDEDVVEGMIEQEKQQQQAQQMIQQLTAGGVAAEQLGKGAQAIQQAGLV